MKKKKLIVILLILLICKIEIFSLDEEKFRDYNLSASFQYNFINPEGKNASARIYLFDTGLFEYREQAGRGITIFSGNYYINKNTIKFINDNSVNREFSYVLNKKHLILKTHEFNQTHATSFHIQPISSASEVIYSRIDYKPLDFHKSQKIDKTYIYFSDNKKFKLIFKKNNSVAYSVTINNKKIDIIEGQYLLTESWLVIEDKNGIRFSFSFQKDEKGIYLIKKSNNFFAPFIKMHKKLKFLISE